MNHGKYHPILWHANKNKLSRLDLYRLLNCTAKTFNDYIKNPALIRISHLMTLAGLFGLKPEELLYLLLRNKPQLKSEDKWYLNDSLQNVVNESEEMYKSGKNS